MRTLEKRLHAFRSLLNTFFPTVRALAEEVGGEELLNDWKQANWELIVEGGVFPEGGRFLVPYGEGADYYGASSRVFRPEAVSTHAVFCLARRNTKDCITGSLALLPAGGLPLEYFVTIREGWYYEQPPFDCVLVVLDGREVVLQLADVQFDLNPAP
ncbi:MAG: hypothetical protein ISS78_09980 [Phycisphaerae bacterium]|nr:hypothetical protein [Phycisphaerae bacterium]